MNDSGGILAASIYAKNLFWSSPERISALHIGRNRLYNSFCLLEGLGRQVLSSFSINDANG